MVARCSPPFRCLLSLGLLGLVACAKTGEPQPPQVQIPQPALDLVVRQYSAKILLSVSPPTVNTNGSAVTTLGRIEIFRLAGNNRSDAGPLREEEFLAQAKRVLTIPATDLPLYLQDGALAFWDDDASSAVATFYTQGFRYAVRFVNRRNQSAGLSNQAVMAPIPIPAAPEGLSYDLFSDKVRLAWKQPENNVDGSVPARIAGYNVYRSQNPKSFPAAHTNAELLSRPGFEDRDFEFDKTYYYAVSVVGSWEKPYAESFLSSPLKVSPVDTFPPGTPRNLTAAAQNGVVTLLWGPPDDADLAGFRVFRMEEGASERIPLQARLIPTLSCRDDQARPGKKYIYSVVAVDTHGNEGQAATITVEVQ
jgi:hypothetical protein